MHTHDTHIGACNLCAQPALACPAPPRPAPPRSAPPCPTPPRPAPPHPALPRPAPHRPAPPHPALSNVACALAWVYQTVMDSLITVRMNSVPSVWGPEHSMWARCMEGVRKAATHCSSTVGSHSWPRTEAARFPTFWSGVVWCGVVWCGVVWCGVPKALLPKGKGRDVYPRVQVNGLGCVCCVRAVCKCVVA